MVGSIVSGPCDLQWFGDKSERAVFDKLGYAGVYAVSHLTDPVPVKIGWTLQPDKALQKLQSHHWLDLTVLQIWWTAGNLLAPRLYAALKAELCKRELQVRGDWFYMPKGVSLLTIVAEIAAREKIETFSHAEMIRRVQTLRERKLQKALAGL